MIKKYRGFTLTEVLITITVLGVLAGLAMPSYFNAMEQSRANEALTNLNIIHMGEKMILLGNGGTGYWGPGATTMGATNTALNLDMSSTYYTGVAINAGGVGPNFTYNATLTRNAVAGGNGTRWYRYDYTNGNAAPVLTQGG